MKSKRINSTTFETVTYKLRYHFYYEKIDRNLIPISDSTGEELVRYFDTWDEAMDYLSELDASCGEMEEQRDGSYFRKSVGSSSWIEEIRTTRYYGII